MAAELVPDAREQQQHQQEAAPRHDDPAAAADHAVDAQDQHRERELRAVGIRRQLHGVVRRAGEPGSATPSFEMRSDYLFIDLEQDVMRTDRPVEVLRGSDRFTADALDYDHKQGISRMTGRVHGVLQPRSTR